MARGFSQQEGERYDGTFSPVATYTSIRAIISLVESMGWNLHQMDVKNYFLNGVYIEQLKVSGYTREKPMYEEGLVWTQASSKSLVQSLSLFSVRGSYPLNSI